MNVYVAAKFEEKDLAKRAMEKLCQAGHVITYNWTLHDDTDDPEELAREARNDAAGVLSADLLVFFPHEQSKGGWFEAGIAWAKGIPIFIVSPMPTPCVFEHLPRVCRFITLHDALAAIRWLEKDR